MQPYNFIFYKKKLHYKLKKFNYKSILKNLQKIITFLQYFNFCM